MANDTQPAYAEYDLASRACSGGLPASERSLLILTSGEAHLLEIEADVGEAA